LLDSVRRYREAGFEALVRKPRDDRRQFRAITPQIAALIERLKREDPRRTGTTLLRELALSSGQDSPVMSASTLYRFLKQHGLSARQLLAGAPLEPHRNSWRIGLIRVEDRKVLTEWRKSKDKNLWQKAVTVLENGNLTPEEIAKRVERPLSRIRKWIKAFNCRGIEGLNPPRKPYAQPKRQATCEQRRRRILEIFHASPRFYGINRSNWNRPSLVLAYRQQHNEAISSSSVGRVIKKSGYTMKKARKVLCSPD